MRRFMGAGGFFYRAPTLLLVASDVDIIKRDRGGNIDWTREQFLDLYYLNAAQSVSVKI